MKIYNNVKLNRNQLNSVIAIGNFDGLHLGHQKVLNEAKQKAKRKRLPFGVITFEPVPVMFFDRKIKVFAHLHGSDLKEFLNDKNYYLKSLKKLYKKEIYQMIILSERHSEFALGKDYNNYKIISNPIDCSYTNCGTKKINPTVTII